MQRREIVEDELESENCLALETLMHVYDKDGKKTAVIIPIDAWMEISSLAEKLERETDEWDPSKYKGMYKGLKIDVKKESNALRDEWTRI